MNQSTETPAWKTCMVHYAGIFASGEPFEPASPSPVTLLGYIILEQYHMIQLMVFALIEANGRPLWRSYIEDSIVYPLLQHALKREPNFT